MDPRDVARFRDEVKRCEWCDATSGRNVSEMLQTRPSEALLDDSSPTELDATSREAWKASKLETLWESGRTGASREQEGTNTRAEAAEALPENNHSGGNSDDEDSEDAP